MPVELPVEVGKMICKECGKEMVHVETIKRGRWERSYYSCHHCKIIRSKKGRKLRNNIWKGV